MALQAPSSSFTYKYTYDVFLNFRGEDTRFGFTGNLNNALRQKGALTFIDDDGLQRGEEITPTLLKAIEESRILIVVFSKNYASSTVCLKELVKILECTKSTGRWIWPIFYDVDPSEVRHQTGSYGEALAKHEEKFKENIVYKWRKALCQASDLSGWHFKHRNEYEHVFVGRVVEEICGKLNRPLLHIADFPVGLEDRMQKLLLLLDANLNNEAKMVGIYGMGGIGKSTVARALYNLIADQFESSCFLSDVREKSAYKRGLTRIQETLLSELVGERNIKLGDVNQGIPILKRRLQQKKILLVIDDVDRIEQLKAIVGEINWFGSGSVIIITTRDYYLLNIHGVGKKYEVKELNDREALELFRWNAFKKNEVDPTFMEIIKRAIHYAHGLPLVLETVGSNLYGRTTDEWISALETYEIIPKKNIQEILKVSYDGLEDIEKEIFLDIACFFNGYTLRDVTNMLHAARGFSPQYGIQVLKDKSLIKLEKGEFDTVTMHNLIQCMGKEIVRLESPSQPKQRSRLWFHEDIIDVFKQKEGFENIEAMMLDFPEDKNVPLNPKAFQKMNNLKMLIIKSACFSREPNRLTNGIRVLEWRGQSPSYSLPSNFPPNNVSILKLSHSFFRWSKTLKNLQNLTQLVLENCERLRQIPDVSGLPNLTELSVAGCANLIEIHDSVGFLDKLQRFSVKNCSKLKAFPRGIKLTSLRFLWFVGCPNLDLTTIAPTSFGSCPSLKQPLCSDLANLMHQALHAPGQLTYLLTVDRMPEWFDHSSWSDSLSFWFRNKFPAIIVGVLFGVSDDNFKFKFCVQINGTNQYSSKSEVVWMKTTHVYMLNHLLDIPLDDVEGLILKQEWNHAKISVCLQDLDEQPLPNEGLVLCAGLHVNQEVTNIEDVQFPPKEEL